MTFAILAVWRILAWEQNSFIGVLKFHRGLNKVTPRSNKGPMLCWVASSVKKFKSSTRYMLRSCPRLSMLPHTVFQIMEFFILWRILTVTPDECISLCETEEVTSTTSEATIEACYKQHLIHQNGDPWIKEGKKMVRKNEEKCLPDHAILSIHRLNVEQ